VRRGVLVVLIVFIFGAWKEPDSKKLKYVRLSYTKALKSANAIDELSRLSSAEKTAIFLAYRGTSKALEARNSSWPTTKISLAKQAYALLNKAVAQDPNSYEIRFLRYSFECETPAWLELNTHIARDEQFLLSNAKKGQPIAGVMKAYFSKNEKLNQNEKEKILSRL
jgi:hypothetical protein